MRRRKGPKLPGALWRASASPQRLGAGRWAIVRVGRPPPRPIAMDRPYTLLYKVKPYRRRREAGARRTDLPAGPLTIGLRGALHVREERLSSRSDACRLMYVSDVHLRRNRSDHLCRQVIEAARSSEIDALLLGGDLIDGATELGKLCDLVGALRAVAPVLVVGGNHDRSVGLHRARDAVVGGG